MSADDLLRLIVVYACLAIIYGTGYWDGYSRRHAECKRHH